MEGKKGRRHTLRRNNVSHIDIQGWDRAENTRFVVADISGHRMIKFCASALLVAAFDLRLCGSGRSNDRPLPARGYGKRGRTLGTANL